MEIDKLYHGNPDNISIKNINLDENGYAFLTPEKSYAESYATNINRAKGFAGFEPKISEFKIKAKKILDLTRDIPKELYDTVDWTSEKDVRDGLMSAIEMPETKKALEKLGYDAVKGYGIGEDGLRSIEYAIFNPKQAISKVGKGIGKTLLKGLALGVPGLVLDMATSPVEAGEGSDVVPTTPEEMAYNRRQMVTKASPGKKKDVLKEALYRGLQGD